MAARRCIVTLATDDRQYPAALDRLEASLARVGFEGAIVSWRGSALPEGAPTHLSVPFGFKPYGLAETANRGHELLLWLDASCVAVRSLDPIFARIERDGYVLFRNRSYAVGEWAADAALEALGLDREQAMALPEVNAAAVGLNMGSEVGAAFLDGWQAAARDGVAFRGVPRDLQDEDDYRAVKWNRDGRVSLDPRVRGHRHDQTVAGVLAARLGMSPTAEWLEIYSSRARTIGPRTRVVVDRDAGKEDAVLASLSRLRRARWLGVVGPRLFRRRAGASGLAASRRLGV